MIQKLLINPITSFMNLHEQPKPVHTSGDYMVRAAWLRTGDYLRRAMMTYKGTPEFRYAARQRQSDKSYSNR